MRAKCYYKRVWSICFQRGYPAGLRIDPDLCPVSWSVGLRILFGCFLFQRNSFRKELSVLNQQFQGTILLVLDFQGNHVVVSNGWPNQIFYEKEMVVENREWHPSMYIKLIEKCCTFFWLVLRVVNIDGNWHTPWKFNSSPPKIYHPKRKLSSSNHHFSGASC